VPGTAPDARFFMPGLLFCLVPMAGSAARVVPSICVEVLVEREAPDLATAKAAAIECAARLLWAMEPAAE
jgi:hypothetical protein